MNSKTTNLKNRSMLGKSTLLLIIFVIALINVGCIYSAFPTSYWYNEIEPLQILNIMTSVYKEFAWPYTSTVLFVATSIMILLLKTRKIPLKFTSRHLLLLLPIFPAILMLVWGSYCAAQPPNGLYSIEQVNDDASWYTGPWLKTPWYGVIIEELFISSMVYAGLLAVYIYLSNNWKGERIFSYFILLTEVTIIFLVKFASEVAAVRPPF